MTDVWMEYDSKTKECQAVHISSDPRTLPARAAVAREQGLAIHKLELLDWSKYAGRTDDPIRYTMASGKITPKPTLEITPSIAPNKAGRINVVVGGPVLTLSWKAPGPVRFTVNKLVADSWTSPEAFPVSVPGPYLIEVNDPNWVAPSISVVAAEAEDAKPRPVQPRTRRVTRGKPAATRSARSKQQDGRGSAAKKRRVAPPTDGDDQRTPVRDEAPKGRASGAAQRTKRATQDARQTRQTKRTGGKGRKRTP